MGISNPEIQKKVFGPRWEHETQEPLLRLIELALDALLPRILLRKFGLGSRLVVYLQKGKTQSNIGVAMYCC